MLSQTAESALRAVLYVAARGDDAELVKIDEIAAELELPRNSLSKTLHALARAGVLASVRGPAGGFRLAVPAEALPLARVVAPFDTVGQGRQCLLGRPTCSDDGACAAHAGWKAVSEQLRAFFQETTVAELLQRGVGAGAI
ncbi:MAG TPA: Rrf2 family transcriptional regulator [Gemmatimonadaceae bacterium]